MVALPSMLLAASCATAASETPSAEHRDSFAIEPDQLVAATTVVNAISQRRADLLRVLIGDEGVAGVGFASGAVYAGHNNANQIVEIFKGALKDADPMCVGYVPDAGALPDKAILVYRDLPIDWGELGLSGTDSEGVTIQLFKLPDGWRLVYLTPFNFDRDLPIIGAMEDCPDG